MPTAAPDDAAPEGASLPASLAEAFRNTMNAVVVVSHGPEISTGRASKAAFVRYTGTISSIDAANLSTTLSGGVSRLAVVIGSDAEAAQVASRMPSSSQLPLTSSAFVRGNNVLFVGVQ